jgi:hypothetical protein
MVIAWAGTLDQTLCGEQLPFAQPNQEVFRFEHPSESGPLCRSQSDMHGRYPAAPTAMARPLARLERWG